MIKTKIIDNIIWEYRPNTNDLQIINHVYTNNSYHLPDNMKRWFVIDVGAHIGSFSIAAVKRGAAVRAYEPCTENFKLLYKNVDELPVYCEKLGIGPFGARFLYLDTKNTGQNSEFKELNALSDNYYELIDFCPLSHIVKDREVDFLKLDCEGGEVAILEEILAGLHNQIKRIAVEFHFFPQDKELRERLSEFYSIESLGSDEYVMEHK